MRSLGLGALLAVAAAAATPVVGPLEVAGRWQGTIHVPGELGRGAQGAYAADNGRWLCFVPAIVFVEHQGIKDPMDRLVFAAARVGGGPGHRPLRRASSRLRTSEDLLPSPAPAALAVYTGDAQKDEMRYQLLKDQLAIYDTHGVSWRIWFYRDLGLQAIVYQHPRGDGAARPAAGPRIPDLGPYPNGAKREARLLVRQILISEARRIIGRVHQTENPV